MPEFPIRVKIDSKGAEVGGKRVENRLSRIENQAGRVQKTITSAFAILGGGAFLVSGVQILKNFSQEMSTVAAVTKATDMEIKSMRDVAKELGATTRFSATQAAEGMTFLARAGFDTNQVMQSIDDTLLLAQAGALDLGRAADIASNVLTGFRINVGEAGRVVDVLAYAANNANTTVEQLGEGMKFVAPVAAGMGVSLEATTAAMSALSDSGLQASLAGTGLRRIMSELEAPASKTKSILNSLGVSTDEVNISQVGLVAALERLKQAGVDTGMALEIFGDRGGPAFEVLASNIPKVKLLEKNLLNSAGTARKMAKVMDDNLNGALLSVRSAFEALIIEFGDLGAESVLIKFFRKLASMLRYVAANIEVVTRVAGALALTFGTVLAGRAIPRVISSFKALTMAMAANPIGLLIVGLTTAISLLVTFSDKIGISSDGIVTLKDYAVAAFQVMRERLIPLLIAMKEGFTNAINTVISLFSGLGITFQDVLGVLKVFINRWIGFYVGLYQATAVVFDKVRDVIISIMGTDTFKIISGTVKGIVNFVVQSMEIIGRIAAKILGDLGLFAKDIADALDFTFDLTVPTSVIDFGIDVKDAFMEGFGRDFVGEIISIADPAFTGIGDRARALAEERKRAQVKAQPKSVQKIATPQGAATVPGTQVVENRQGIRNLLSDLDDQAKLLKLTNEERAIQNELTKIQNDLTEEGITLSDAEVQIIEERLKGIESLQVQADLYESMNARLNKYVTTQSALNALLGEGRISQEQYNAAIQETQLSTDLSELQEELLGGETNITAQLQEQLFERQLIIDEALQARLITEEEHLALMLEANENYNDAVFRAELQKNKMALSAASSTFGSLADITASFAGKQSKTYQTLFKISKAFAIAESTVAVVQAIAEATKTGWPQNIAAIAATLAQTAGLISQIRSVQFGGGFQTGGSFRVKGSGGADSQLVAFRATPGERVDVSTPAQQAQAAAPAPAASPLEGLSIINVTDKSIIKDYMNSTEGQRVMINNINGNKEEINATLQQ